MDKLAFFKCPGCGANLSYDATSSGLTCPYCGSDYAVNELKPVQTEDGWSADQETLDDEAGLKGYHCRNCGAEIVTGETTAATRCYFCHGPVVLLDKIAGEYRPDGVIPFTVNRDSAVEAFDKMIRKKWYRKKQYFREAESDISGVYYPYWYADLGGKGSFDGTGYTKHTKRQGDYLVTTKKYYHFRQGGKVYFRNIYRKALTAPERQLTDGIHPYDTETVKSFSVDYLSGFLAERRDVDRESVKNDIIKETEGHTRTLMTRHSGLDGLTGTSQLRVGSVRMRYLLLPTWVMTWRNKDGTENYTYMINGQNGKTCGRVPLNKGPLIWVSILSSLIPAAAAFFLTRDTYGSVWGRLAACVMLCGWPGLVVYFATAASYKLSAKTYKFDMDKQSSADYEYRDKTFLRKEVTRTYSPVNKQEPKRGGNHHHGPGHGGHGHGGHPPGRRR